MEKDTTHKKKIRKKMIELTENFQKRKSKFFKNKQR